MRIFAAQFLTETNTFAPFPTSLRGFEENGITRLGDDPAESTWQILSELAAEGGDELIGSLNASAQPSGRVIRRTYEMLRDRILTDLSAAGPVDIVLLLLHGAMVADGVDDCEGDIIARVRAIAPDAVIGVLLDPHCHLSAAMTAHADLVVIYKEYPHIDVADRGRELFRLCRRARLGEIRPVGAVADPRMIGIYPTFAEPMAGIVRELRTLEQSGAALSASVAHGFPWGDVADVGTRTLVYTDGDPERACAEAARIAGLLYAARDDLLPDYPKLEAALDRAAALPGLTVIGDHADNPGGGAPGDSTFVLRALIERGARDAAIGSFHDPAVVAICSDAGEGAVLDVRLGGKAGPASGDPVDCRVEVLAVRERHVQGVFDTRMDVGAAVALRCGGIDILVNTLRTQVYDPNFFTGCGIDLAAKRLVVVKSSSHFEAAFATIAMTLFRASTPGALQLDFATFAYTRRDGCYHPRVADPLDGAPIAARLVRPAFDKGTA